MNGRRKKGRYFGIFLLATPFFVPSVITTTAPPASVRAEDAPAASPVDDASVRSDVEYLAHLQRLLRKTTGEIVPTIVTIETRTKKTLDDSPRAKIRTVEETGIGFAFRCGGKTCIVTNYHVVAGVEPESIRLTLHDRRFFNAFRTSGNEEFDIAVIEVAPEDVRHLVPAPCGNSDHLEVADFVLAFGSPFGLKESVSLGIVSAKNRRSIPSGNHQMPLQAFIQTDAAINPGNSGGPLVALDGKVVGMVTAIASGSGNGEGVAFAIPVNSVVRIATQLVEYGTVTRPYLGVELDPRFDVKAHVDVGLDRLIGAKILTVQPDSPAANAGLLPGDIVLRYDGTEIEDNLHLIQLVALTGENEFPEMIFLRDGARHRVRPRLTLQVSR